MSWWNAATAAPASASGSSAVAGCLSVNTTYTCTPAARDKRFRSDTHELLMADEDEVASDDDGATDC